jgi:hypothetical protein
MTETMMPGLGRWKSPPDERDRNYALRANVSDAVAETPLEAFPTYKYHRVPNPRLNQGSTSQCTIYSVKQCALTGPNVIKTFSATEQEMYEWCQRNDAWPGSETVPPTYKGTSTRASGRAAVLFGIATRYLWCFSIDDIIRALQLGPVVIGMDWWEHMSRPDKNNFIHIGGQRQGGHQIEISGYNRSRSETKFRLPNSWGNGWAVNGMCWASFSTIGDSMDNGGEVMRLEEVSAA